LTRPKQSESTLHDYPIYEICAIAESHGYKVEERLPGSEQGPDIVVGNFVVAGSVFKDVMPTLLVNLLD